MTITEILQIADQLVFSQTGRHLDDLQEAVIKGVWQGQTYEQIGEDCNRSEGRVRDVGYRLWEILSQQLGEDINKYNFRSTFERLHATSSQIIIQNDYRQIIIQNDLKFGYYPHEFIKNISNHSQNNQLSYHNLKQAPRLTQFYGRKQEIAILSEQLENPNINLISVLGVEGVGKTTLGRNLINNYLEKFDIIIWKNLKLGQSLTEIITETLSNINSDLKTSEVCKFFDLLSEKRCLIILDHFESIFTPQELSGHYQPQYEEYKTFLQMLTEIDHQSCLILISREKCQEMVTNQFSYCLELSGLDQSAHNILQQQDLKNQERWLELITLYEGNPKFLQEISILIKDVFNGKVAEFLKNNLLLTENRKFAFDSLWLRLSDLERKILIEINQQDNNLTMDHLQQSLNLSYQDMTKALQSLKQRFLLTNADNGLKILSSILREYISTLLSS